MLIRFNDNGTAETIYTESIDLADLGSAQIKRASHVEPDNNGQWEVDLSPLGLGVLGSFPKRSEALKAEVDYIEREVINR